MSERATLRENRDIEDTRYLKRLLQDCGGNFTRATRVAGFRNRSSLYRLLARLGLERPPTSASDSCEAMNTWAVRSFPPNPQAEEAP